MWERIKAFFGKLVGYGECFSCGNVGWRSWLRERYKGPDGVQELRYEAYLCSACFRNRTAKWNKWIDEQFDGVFKDFDESFRRRGG